MGVEIIQVWGDSDSGLGSLVETPTEVLPSVRVEPKTIVPEVTPQLQVVIPSKRRKRSHSPLS